MKWPLGTPKISATETYLTLFGLDRSSPTRSDGRRDPVRRLLHHLAPRAVALQGGSYHPLWGLPSITKRVGQGFAVRSAALETVRHRDNSRSMTPRSCGPIMGHLARVGVPARSGHPWWATHRESSPNPEGEHGQQPLSLDHPPPASTGCPLQLLKLCGLGAYGLRG